jgi:hypothetical protein
MGHLPDSNRSTVRVSPESDQSSVGAGCGMFMLNSVLHWLQQQTSEVLSRWRILTSGD